MGCHCPRGLRATDSQELHGVSCDQPEVPAPDWPGVSAGTVRVQIGQQTSLNASRALCGLASQAWANPASQGLLFPLPDLGQSPQAVKEERGLSCSLGWILNSQGIVGSGQVESERGSQPNVGESR